MRAYFYNESIPIDCSDIMKTTEQQKESMRSYMHLYYLANKEERQQYFKERQQNPEFKKRRKAYLDKNREHIAERMRKYNAEHKAKLNLKHKEYYRKQFLVNSNLNIAHNFSFKHRVDILNKLGKKCFFCGSEKNLKIHHQKYTKNLSDMLILCQICHTKIHKLKHKIRNRGD